MAINRALLELLAPGEWVSGEQLGHCLGVSRAAVWKSLQGLQVYGLELESQRGRGYRVVGGIDLLNEEVIRQRVAGTLSEGVPFSVDVRSELDSTNFQLMEAARRGENLGGRVLFAEYQSAGKGRRGRAWVSPFARNLYFSLAWNFSQGVAALEGLSLAVGCVICRQLRSLGVCAELKWPNDILIDGKKLGGVLIELVGDVAGDCSVVVGVGLNVNMKGLSDSTEIDQAWTDLRQEGCELPRTELAVCLVSDLCKLLYGFERVTFAAYKEEWESYNAYKGRRVLLSSASSSEEGEVLGVSENGGLRLLTSSGEQVFVGGELSVRLQ